MSEPNWIEIAGLTNYEIAPDGSSVKLNMLDAAGNDASVIIPMEQLQALTLSMPKIMGMALRAASGDPTLRLVHTATSWKLERSADEEHVILTVETPEFPPTSFALLESEVADMARALAAYRIEAFPQGLSFH